MSRCQIRIEYLVFDHAIERVKFETGETAGEV